MATVVLKKCRSYHLAKEAIAATVDKLGGMAHFVKPGDSVLIKPNLLGAHAPDEAVTTHPSVVQAVAELILDCRGRPVVADSPGIDRFRAVAAKTGMARVGQELGIPVIPLTDSCPVPPRPGTPFRRIELSRQILEADRIVNLPKMKTHCQMTLTLGVKNLFGTVVAQRKAEWHYKVGLDRDRFARLLVEIWAACPPALTILDGVLGMEGQGPSNGTARRFDLIAASDNSLALDLTLAPMMGVPLPSFPLYRSAKKAGVLPKNIRRISDPRLPLQFKSVILPPEDSLRLLPSLLDNFGRDILASRPVQNRQRCVLCGKCVRICPADAITLRGAQLVFDYQSCIRCYCCQEMCPQDAIDLQKGLLLRLLDILHR